MNLVVAITVGVLAACGVFMVLRNCLVFVALGIGLLGTAVNLLVVAVGRVQGAPALSQPGIPLEQLANPLPQAFVLTAIVIGFSVVTLMLRFAQRVECEPEVTQPSNQEVEKNQD